MTPEQHKLCFALATVPGRPEPMQRSEFLRRWGEVSDGAVLGLELLTDATDRASSIDVECALLVCFKFADDRHLGFGHLDPLIRLAYADWHTAHENVASALDDSRSPTAVAALRHLATWVPDYLVWDPARALGVKAIWGLGNIGTPDAIEALRFLAQSRTEVIADNAVQQLERRRS